jgi:hypothetical protein
MLAPRARGTTNPALRVQGQRQPISTNVNRLVGLACSACSAWSEVEAARQRKVDRCCTAAGPRPGRRGHLLLLQRNAPHVDECRGHIYTRAFSDELLLLLLLLLLLSLSLSL